MRKIGVGIMGLGTVGTGVYKVLVNNADIIARRVGAEIVVKRILEKDQTRERGIAVPPELYTLDVNDILNDPEIDIVVEVLGGISPAREFILAAMNKGKSVVTANKDLIALHGQELFETAEKNNVDFLFEASVGGGIPIIRPLKQCLAANNIRLIYGIVNGTTNYMLSKMSLEGREYEDVLKEAQAKGYAEANPASDVEGLDAARKLAILASIAFNTRLTINDVYVEGITKISARDIEYARELGYVIKLLAIGKEENGEVEVRVHPALVPIHHPMASVNDVYNAIFVRGDAVGDTMFYGRGAGELPTASAVVGDIMEAARNLLCGTPCRIGCTCYEEKKVRDIKDTASKFYVRMKVVDKPGVLAAIASVFGNQEVSLASVIQKRNIGPLAEIVWVTHRARERNMQDALQIIGGLSIVAEISNVIRVEGEDD